MKEAKDTTNEFSFLLKPGEHGVGVFATHDIKKGTYLRLFGEEKDGWNNVRYLADDDPPKPFKDFCIDRKVGMLCPSDFGAMPVGWYVNHSKSPNAIHKNYLWYGVRDIAEGEEITIDYNTFEEPEELKEEYYKNL